MYPNVGKIVGNMYLNVGQNSREHVSKGWQKQSGTCIQTLGNNSREHVSKSWQKTVGNMYPQIGKNSREHVSKSWQTIYSCKQVTCIMYINAL